MDLIQREISSGGGQGSGRWMRRSGFTAVSRRLGLSVLLVVLCGGSVSGDSPRLTLKEQRSRVRVGMPLEQLRRNLGPPASDSLMMDAVDRKVWTYLSTDGTLDLIVAPRADEVKVIRVTFSLAGLQKQAQVGMPLDQFRRRLKNVAPEATARLRADIGVRGDLIYNASDGKLKVSVEQRTQRIRKIQIVERTAPLIPRSRTRR